MEVIMPENKTCGNCRFYQDDPQPDTFDSGQIIELGFCKYPCPISVEESPWVSKNTKANNCLYYSDKQNNRKECYEGAPEIIMECLENTDKHNECKHLKNKGSWSTCNSGCNSFYLRAQLYFRK